MDWPIITLTTDWGERDFFAGMVKGRLMREIQNVRIVDITHQIDPQYVGQAIFIVQHACLNFPPGTIHIIDVNTYQTDAEPFVVVEYNQQYFICTDNGLPYLVFGDKAQQAVLIDIPSDSSFHNFVAHDLFCKVAAMLAQGHPLSDIGPAADSFHRKTPYAPKISDNRIEAHIIYIDAYGNCYLNIPYDQFEAVRGNRQFSFQIRLNDYSTGLILHNYNDKVGDPYKQATRHQLMLTVSATGLLELAVCAGNIADLQGLQIGETVIITFR